MNVRAALINSFMTVYAIPETHGTEVLSGESPAGGLLSLLPRILADVFEDLAAGNPR